MSFFEDASLVLIPSAQKTSKVYSVKPTDGTGDLTFTRSNDTATRVGPDGLIEKVRTNLLTYSNDLSNAAWNKLTNGTYTITSETITDPFGVSVAVQKVTLTSGTYVVFRNTLGAATTTGTTGSIYIKKTVSTTAVDADLSDVDSDVAANNTDWQRLVSINPSGGSFLDVTISTANEPVYIAYAQIELSDFGATPYIATTSAAVSVGPVANVPRLDYLGSSCPRLLLEPQRTNSQTYSEDLTQSSAWGLGATTISANATTSPDGYQNADKLVEDATTARHELYGKTLTFSGTSSVSFYAKAAGRRYVSAFVAGNPALGGATYDLQTGTITATSGGTTANIEAVSGATGWYRCSFTSTAAASTTLYICLRTTGGAPNIETYAGDGTSGVYFWGGQTELAGAYATSYIPTLGAAVTRGADVGGNKTSASALIGQTEGTMFLEFVAGQDTSSNSGVLYGIFDSTSANNRIQLVSRLGLLATYIEVNSVGYAVNPTLATLTNGTTYKAALAYSAAGVVIYVNGVSVYTNASALAFTATLETISVGSRATIDSYGKGERISQTLLFKTRLSNADLAARTA